ncbi:MAG: hypothetical protein R3A80_11125 [Bdellovibrionota bacterium]
MIKTFLKKNSLVWFCAGIIIFFAWARLTNGSISVLQILFRSAISVVLAAVPVMLVNFFVQHRFEKIKSKLARRSAMFFYSFLVFFAIFGFFLEGTSKITGYNELLSRKQISSACGNEIKLSDCGDILLMEDLAGVPKDELISAFNKLIAAIESSIVLTGNTDEAAIKLSINQINEFLSTGDYANARILTLQIRDWARFQQWGVSIQSSCASSQNFDFERCLYILSVGYPKSMSQNDANQVSENFRTKLKEISRNYSAAKHVDENTILENGFKISSYLASLDFGNLRSSASDFYRKFDDFRQFSRRPASQ